MAGEDLEKGLNGSGRTLLEQDLMMGSGGHPAQCDSGGAEPTQQQPLSLGGVNI